MKTSRIVIGRNRLYGGHEISNLTVRVERGGPMWKPYDKLPESAMNEWDAFENILVNLSDGGKKLYISGVFRTDTTWTGHGHEVCRVQNDTSGTYAIIGWENLHRALVENPKEHYGFLIVEELLCDPVLERIAIDHITKGKSMTEATVDLHDTVYCSIEECVDRDWFGLACKAEDREMITCCIETTLGKSGIS